MQGVQAVTRGVQELKKDIGPKRGRGALLGFGRKKPNRSGSSEPDRFRISYLKGDGRFYFSFFPILSLSSSFLDSLQISGSGRCHLLRRVAGSGAVAGKPSRLRRRAGVQKLLLFLLFFRLSSSFHSLFPILDSKIAGNHHKFLDLE